LAPNTTAKLDVIRQSQEQTLTVTIGEMSNEHQAKADTEQGTPTSDVPHLGLSLAPASDVAGAGDKGVVVMVSNRMDRPPSKVLSAVTSSWMSAASQSPTWAMCVTRSRKPRPKASMLF
jgi:hypothetical protein